MFINGEWRESSSNEWIDVNNPANGDLIGKMAKGTTSDTSDAIDAAHRSFTSWSKTPGKDRSRILRKWYELIIKHKEDIAKIMTSEQGKPMKEAIGEIIYGAGFVEWYAEEAKRIYGETIPSNSNNKRILVHKQPVGVIGAITPWNFPAAMITRKIAPALAAGCTAIVKPASATPLTAVKLFELLEEAGLPQGVANLIVGSANDIGEVLLNDERVRKITFTGSTKVGKMLMEKSSKTVKNISLELGGHAPLLIFEDADLDKAVEGTMSSKFRNGGQVCIATNRVYVQESIKEKYLSKLKEKVGILTVGNGFDNDTDIGPIIDKEGYDKINMHIKDAIDKGASIVTGGNGKHEGDCNDFGYFFIPTILDNANEEMIMMNEETFGPIVPVTTFKYEDEAIKLANDTNYGLAAYVFTENLSRGFKVTEALEYGIVGLNDGAPSTPQAPFGGFKESGIGREGGHLGIEEFLEVKYISIGL
ncbi:NAD-dependent succinate-semialdehyde dehydrogenase [Clostridium sp. D2Q-11]|uniref:NAD-dependent succinate-semialdehyde dehydrogenase n=1 Tax=Anaeromonas frigoriresistens TaxID=2683708 RepID=A0A942Z6M6_9FIRM|nr:NAD-dependent succinate-semialdehyde dehydrogenase [Anaeromonas frigoriresistens]MBS4537742.1 NAD-dependent succinate-semialdehyde dehydrogenase [Anaeromonas frigoriresistens]